MTDSTEQSTGTVAPASPVATDIDTAANDLLAIVQLIAAFDPAIAAYLTAATLAVKLGEDGINILTAPATVAMFKAILAAVSNKSPEGQAYIAAAQEAFAEGLKLDSDEAKARWPALGNYKPVA